MRRSTASSLLAVFTLGVILRLSPLTRFLYFGSDFGEYFQISRGLSATGHVSLEYTGWGITYPYFPGMFFPVVGTSFGGLELGGSLSLVIPVLGAFVTVVAFLLTARFLHEDKAALIGAAFLAVAMPQAFVTAHPTPAALAELLVAATLLLFLRLRGDARIWVLLIPLTAALIVTHHLSAYFLLVMLVLATVASSLVAGRVPSRSQAIYLAVLASLTFAYWFVYATTFRVAIITDVNVDPWWLPLAAFPVLVLLLAGAIALRRKSPWRYRPRFPTSRHITLVYGLGFATILVIEAASALFTIPGTAIRITPTTIVVFLPLAALISFAAAGRKPTDFARDGIAPSGWLLALVLSVAGGAVIAPRVLIPYRHMEYIVLVLAPLIGAGFALWSEGALRPRARGAAVAIAALLVVGGALTAIPSTDELAGYEAGIRPSAVDAAFWAGLHVDGLVATDHRLSTVLFGFGGVGATWDRAPLTLLASSFGEARSEMESVAAPSGDRRVDFVAIDRDLLSGVQLLPYEPVNPMPPGARAKFLDSPYIKILDSGFAQVFFVNWGLVGGPSP